MAVSNFRRLQTVSNGVEYKKKGEEKEKQLLRVLAVALMTRSRSWPGAAVFFLFFFLVPPPMVVALMKTDVGGRVVVYRVFTEFYVIS